LSLLATVREAVVRQRSIAVFLPLIDIEFAKEKALQGDIDDAVDLLRAILERENASTVIGPQGPAAEVLVELLLQRGGTVDVAAAREAIDWLTAMPTEPGVVIYEIALLRLRALLARACCDELEYRQYVDRYRAMANQIGFEGHIAMAEAMT
jgi:adenylate cyclase